MFEVISRRGISQKHNSIKFGDSREGTKIVKNILTQKNKIVRVFTQCRIFTLNTNFKIALINFIQQLHKILTYGELECVNKLRFSNQKNLIYKFLFVLYIMT